MVYGVACFKVHSHVVLYLTRIVQIVEILILGVWIFCVSLTIFRSNYHDFLQKAGQIIKSYAQRVNELMSSTIDTFWNEQQAAR